MATRNARKEQVERALAKKLGRTAGAAGRRWLQYGGRGKSPGFCWTTERVEHDGETGWASYVRADASTELALPIPESFVLHRTRKAAKARAWNLYQGWRLARGLKVTWRSFA